MKTRRLFYILPFLLSLACGKSVKPQVVVYSEGALPEGDGNEDAPIQFPPEEEWFRVRGAHRNHHHSQVSQAISHGESEIIELPRSGGWNPKQVVSSAVVVEQQHRGSHVEPMNVRDENGNNHNNDKMQAQVQVRSRGKVGLQSRRMRKETEDEEEGVITRRLDDREDDDWESSPRRDASSPGGGRQHNTQNVHIRHKSGRNNEESSKGGIRGVPGRSRQQQQQPREPDEEDFVEGESNSRKQGGNVQRQQSPKNGPRVDSNDDAEIVEYVDDNVNERQNDDGNDRPVQAQAVRNGNGEMRSIKSSRGRNNALNRNRPPPHEQVAKMARYIVHNSNWTSIATISTMNDLRGYPFANVISVSDGPINDSSGIPYMYMTPLDMSATDLKHDSRASLTMSLAQSDYCRKQEYDPEDPRCAHVILSGTVKQVTSPDEREFAMNACFSRHPDMTDWPKDHGWYFAKLDIEHIVVLDYFGGGKTVRIDDYFNQ